MTNGTILDFSFFFFFLSTEISSSHRDVGIVRLHVARVDERALAKLCM